MSWPDAAAAAAINKEGNSTMTDNDCESCKDTDCPEHADGPEGSLEDFLERQEIEQTVGRIRHKVFVLSGKGGVGKSTVAANMAVALALDGKSVGLLDIDIHGPSIPKLLKLEGRTLDVVEGKIVPATYSDKLKVVSIAFMLPDDQAPVIWRGPMKMGVIKQFIKDVAWGELDYLIVDSPPGTGDEPLSICQLIPDADGAVVVTTPQALSVVDVRKCVGFCQQLDLPVIGVIENMSGLACPHCGERIEVFKAGGGAAMAQEMEVPFLGAIPLDPALVATSDAGTPLAAGDTHSATAQDILRIVRAIQAGVETAEPAHKEPAQIQVEKPVMKIAIPVAEGKLCMHFGHCEHFAMVEVDTEKKQVVNTQMLQPPAHEPGVLPRWLSEQGADVILAGGMGARAQGFFREFGIAVVVGAPSGEPGAVVQAWLDGTLKLGSNICDH